MNDGTLQLALRELRREFSQPLTWVVLTGAALVMALIAPFGTDTTLTALERPAYWFLLILLTYATGSFISTLGRAGLTRYGVPVVICVTGAATGVAICAIVLAVNAIVFRYLPPPEQWISFFGTIFAISVILSALFSLIAMQLADSPPAPVARPPALLDRLPFEKRGTVIAVSVEDHYVRVQTTKGEEMLLLRLSDAIRELDGTTGAQVHRSHWVNFSEVTAARRDGDRALLTLSNGTELPVSRANLPKIRDAGLLPKR